MNNAGYLYLQSRKKDRLTPSDLKNVWHFVGSNCHNKGQSFGPEVFHFIWIAKGLSSRPTPLIKLMHQRGKSGGNEQMV